MYQFIYDPFRTILGAATKNGCQRACVAVSGTFFKAVTKGDYGRSPASSIGPSFTVVQTSTADEVYLGTIFLDVRVKRRSNVLQASDGYSLAMLLSDVGGIFGTTVGLSIRTLLLQGAQALAGALG